MEMIDHTMLGRTGTQVSRVCLGAMTMGTLMDRDESFRTLDFFAEQGGNFIDTANCYSWWVGKGENVGDESEAMLGEWMHARKNRERIFLATKCGARLREPRAIRDADGNPRWAEVPSNYEGASRRVILGAVQDSLRRLRTDYIDLYYVHVDDRETPLEETLGTLNELVASGVVRHLGYSNVRTWRLERIRALCERNGWAQPVAIQQEYSFLRPAAGANLGVAVHADGEFFDYLAENPSMTLLAYSPLLKGIYASREKRLAYYNWSLYDTPDSAARLERLEVVGKRLGLDGNTLVLAWMLHRKPAIIPIVGGSRFSHFRENVAALDVRLDGETMEYLEGRSASV
jgi:aryl-alcohol dehydrogenase-like predicted oxidoreductase